MIGAEVCLSQENYVSFWALNLLVYERVSSFFDNNQPVVN